MREPNRGGAPAGNLNNVRHGHRSNRDGVVLAKLGRRFNGAYHDVCRLRVGIERLVSNGHESIPLRQRMKIQSICRLETSIRALEMAIRDDGKMGTAEMRSCRESISRWTVQRDNALNALLGTRDTPTSEWDEIDQMGVADMGVEGTQDGPECDPNDDTDETTPGDATHANGVPVDVEGDRRNPTAFWAEVDQEIAAERETNGDGGNQS